MRAISMASRSASHTPPRCRPSSTSAVEPAVTGIALEDLVRHAGHRPPHVILAEHQARRSRRSLRFVAHSSSVRASRDPLHGRMAPYQPSPRPRLIGVRGTVVMGTYNEAASIGPVLAELDEAAPALRRADIELDVLLVDDDSPDGTAAVARREADRFGLPLEVITGPGRVPGAALLAGFRHVVAADAADFIVTLDPDGRHDARQITDLVRMFLARRSGLTIGSRWVRGGSSPGTAAPRALASRAASALVRRSTGLRRVRDATTSFWVVDVDVVRTVLEDGLQLTGYGFYPAFVALAQAYGFSIDEVPIVYRPRYSDVARCRCATSSTSSAVSPRSASRVQEVRAKMRADQATWASRSGRMRDQEATVDSSFGADVELERLASAERFIGWIADEIAPHLGRRVLEVGAGIGSVSTGVGRAPARRRADRARAGGQPLRRAARASWWPCRDHRPQSDVDRAAGRRPRADVRLGRLRQRPRAHPRRRAASCATRTQLLVPGGTLAIFVPALPRLYGCLDYKSGHHRRYLPRRPGRHGRGGRVRGGRRALPRRARCCAVLRDVPAARREVARRSVVDGLRPRRSCPSAARCSGSCPIPRSARTCSPSPAGADRVSGRRRAGHDDVVLVEQDLVRVAVDQVGEQLLLGRPDLLPVDDEVLDRRRVGQPVRRRRCPSTTGTNGFGQS